MNELAIVPDTELNLLGPDEGFLPDQPKQAKAGLDWHATPSQVQGLKRLDELAEIFVRVGAQPQAGYRTLTKSLMLGESGSGKSRLAREFAKLRDWPFLSVDCGSWIPQGSLTKPSTLHLVRDHLRKYAGAFSVVYLDEICKLLPANLESNSSWTLGCWAEALALCDADSRLRTHEWTDGDIRLLRETCYIIAGGAFTAALKDARASKKRGDLGFGTREPSAASVTHSSKVREQLPEELCSRFHPTHVMLEVPSRADYANAIERIHAELKVPRTRPMKELLDEAQSCPGGMRWVEAYLTELLVVNPDRLPKERDEWQPTAPKGFDFFTGDHVHYAREATEASFQLRGLLIRLQADITIRQMAVSKSTHHAFNEFLYGVKDHVQNKLHKALLVANACGEVKPDDSAIIDPILFWREASWKGITVFPKELAKYGLLEPFTKSWDLATRTAELRTCISQGVAAGRYGLAA